MFHIDYEVTTLARNDAKEALRARMKALGVGAPTMCFLIERKLAANKSRIRMIDDKVINESALNPRDITNFLKGTNMTLQKLYVVIAYLVLTASLAEDS